jgi:hypothetical protein
VIERIRLATGSTDGDHAITGSFERARLHANFAQSGTDTVDIAIAYLENNGEIEAVLGKPGSPNQLFRRPLAAGAVAPKSAGRIWPGKGLAHLRASMGGGGMLGTTYCGLKTKPAWTAAPEAVKPCAACDEEQARSAARSPAPPPPKAPPTTSTVRGCRVCGCSDAAACGDGDTGECTWEEPDLCSVCHRLCAKALEICHAPIVRSAVVKALTSAKGKAKGGGSIETWDKTRTERALTEMENRGALQATAGKLTAVTAP